MTGLSTTGQYTYVFCDLLTNQIISVLPAQRVTFTNQLNGAGTFTGEINMADLRVQRLNPLAATIPGRTALYIDRGGVLVWGGIIWKRRYSSQGQNSSGDPGTLLITGQEFWSYFKKLLCNAGTFISGQDQLAAANALVGTASSVVAGFTYTGPQSTTSSNIGVLTPGAAPSGVNRTVWHYGYELKPYGDMVEEVAVMDGGFDFAIDVAWSGTTPTKTFNTGYPRRGRIATGTGLVFSFPGNVTDFDYDEDATQQATRLFVQGAGEGSAMQNVVQVAADLLAQGWPLLDATISFKDNYVTGDPTVSAAALSARARAESAALKSTVTLPSLYVRADRDPILGSYIVGDSITIIVPPTVAPPGVLSMSQTAYDSSSVYDTETVAGLDGSPRFPQGFTTTARIQTISVTPQEDNQPEQVQLIVGPDLVGF